MIARPMSRIVRICDRIAGTRRFLARQLTTGNEKMRADG